MNEVIKTAPTVEEAIRLALEEMGLSREQVTCEVIDYPEKKFFFKKPAKVKVVKIEEEFSLEDIFRDEKKQPVKEKPARPRPKKEKQPAAEKKTEKKERPRPAREKPQAAEQPENEEMEKVGEDRLTPKVRYAMEFLHSVIGRFHSQPYTIDVYKSSTGYVLKITGDDLGVLIGRKGETMEALSYLTGLAANRSDDSFEKITVDIADYRRKKEKDLENSARKAAAKVLKTGRPFGFEPMNPYDRRIIHAVIGQIEGVKSESKGEGARRRVMVYSTAPRQRRPRNGRKPYGRQSRREKPAPQVQKTREEKLVDSTDVGLYSKIEL